MLAFTFASFLGLADFLGLGNSAKDFYLCSDPGFFVVKDENGLTGQKALVLKGVLKTPQRGFAYTFQFLGVNGPQAYAAISAGQPVSAGRGLPAMGEIQIEQRFVLPEAVGLLHVRVNGVTAQPFEITCDITPAIRS